MKYLFPLICALLFTNCSSNSTTSEADTGQEEISSQEEVTPENLELTDLEGNPIQLSNLKGQAVFLNLWATWCRPCLSEMPAIEKAYQTLKDEGFVFMAASYEDPQKITEFMQKQDFSFPFVHLKSDMQALGVQSIPTTYIYNDEGKVVARIIGTREWDDPEVIARLKAWKTAEAAAGL